MVLAARLRGHPRGADRGGRAPRAREPPRRPARPPRLPRVRDRGPGRGEVPRGRAAGPASHLGADRAARATALGLPADDPVLAVFGGLAGAQALNDFAADTWGERGPAILHIAGERDYDAVRARVDRPDYVLLATTDRFGEALAVADLALSRAGGTVWELAAAGTPADPRPVSARDGRSPVAERPPLRGGRRRGRRAPGGARPRPGARRRAARRPRAPRADARGDARLAKPEAADEIADELVRLAGARS